MSRFRRSLAPRQSGIYLATNASKSDIYTTPNDAGERCVMLVRACLGQPEFTKTAMREARKPGERPDGRGPYNSIVAVTQEYATETDPGDSHAAAAALAHRCRS